jgi:hypothetical protein
VNIPQPLEDIIKKNRGLYSSLLYAVERTETWLNNCPCIFFPEYTRHDNLHNEEVLLTALELVTSECWPLITPEDVAVWLLPFCCMILPCI